MTDALVRELSKRQNDRCDVTRGGKKRAIVHLNSLDALRSFRETATDYYEG